MSVPLQVTVIPERCAVAINGQELVLTRTEYALFAVMAGEPGRAFRRRELVERAIATQVEDRTVDTHIKAIRRKLGNCGKYIESVRGLGYRWEPPTAL
jgi:DNA-binding response OmpR family regulator